MPCYDCDWYDECDHSYCEEKTTSKKKMQLSEEDATFNDCISRSSIIRSIMNYQGGAVDKVVAKKLIEQEPSAQPEPHWIPCSERLPEANGRYLVTRGLNACGAMWNRVYIANYSDLMGIRSEKIWWQGNVGKSDFEGIDDVKAWIPLPEPYKEEQE